ncbi:MAG: polysulfide reductase [Chloroflexi bacterium GWC2_73_18]|nr:MAG: polysulfide reductase [Chloroflexi bacterium GWC2_73_18]
MTKQRTLAVLAALSLLALAVGAIGVVEKFLTGERLAGYGSYVPWGLWVALYFHGVGIAGGVFAVGAVGYLAGVPGLREHFRVTLWVSVVALAVGLLAIWMDLGQQWRAYRILIDPSFASMLAFNSWMYVFFFAAMGLLFLLTFNKRGPSALNDRSGWLVPLIFPALLMAIAFPSQSGAVFGVVDAKPFWTTSLLPMLFLASAVTAGSAVLLLVHTFLAPEGTPATGQPLRVLRHVTIGGVVAYFVLEFAEYSVALWAPASAARESLELVLFGPFWWTFWLVHLGGGLLALLLMTVGRTMPVIGTGAFLVAVTFISARLNILIPGQSVQELRGLREAFTHPRLSLFYEATLNEYLVAVFLSALGVALVVLGIVILSRGGATREATAA